MCLDILYSTLMLSTAHLAYFIAYAFISEFSGISIKVSFDSAINSPDKFQINNIRTLSHINKIIIQIMGDFRGSSPTPSLTTLLILLLGSFSSECKTIY